MAMAMSRGGLRNPVAGAHRLPGHALQIVPRTINRPRIWTDVRDPPPPMHPARRRDLGPDGSRRQRWQVSWLADQAHPTAFPGCNPVASDRTLSAYSCGGSRGIAPRSLFTFRPVSDWPDGRTIPSRV
jgi:hypothetical protein